MKQLKTTTLLLLPLVMACFALLPGAQAENPLLLPAPPPDGAYPGFNTAEGFQALINVNTATGVFNTAIGAKTLSADTTGAHNTAVGGQALLNNNGSYNTAVGENALVFNTSGGQNMALGQGALANNSTGNNNTAMGFQALNANTASGNVAVGFQALKANSTSGFPQSDGTNNAIGYQALVSNVSGDDNQAFGFQALLLNTGSFNNAFGWEALRNLSSGNLNTAIGDGAGRNLTTGTGNVYIGASQGGVAVESDTTYIRNVFNSVATARAVYVNSNNKIGTLLSTRRVKDDIKPMDKASEVILALKPVTFRFKKEIEPNGAIQFGLIAEEVEQVDPDLIIRDAQGKPESVRYEQINAMLLNEFLKEHKKVQELEATVAQQQKGMEALVTQVKEQAAQIQKVSAQVETIKPAPKVVANQ
jgi:trimeric autotransporter adhesin